MNILAIGNSFSIDATHYLYGIATTEKFDINLANLYIGGCPLELHAANLKGDIEKYSLYFNSKRTGFYVTLTDAIQSRQWDIITIQQGSMKSFDEKNYYPYLTELMEYIKEAQPLAKIILHETWGYGDGCYLLNETGFSNFEEMSERVISTYRKVYKDNCFDGIIPSGELLVKLYKSGMKKLHRDGIHVSFGGGRYALALLWYRCLTGKNVKDIEFNSFDERISDEEIDLIKKSVDSFPAFDFSFGINKKLGFGCMRMTMKDDEVDYDVFCEMIDTYMQQGFNYFDTAHGYIGGKSETAIRDCLAARYPRDRYVLTNKLSHNFFEKEEDIRPFFQSQLKACGVEYFDLYLMHAQTRALFEKYKRCKAYETALALKDEGKIKHFGISFHDTAEVLEEILLEYPQIEVVQIQFNYLDFNDASVQSRKNYEICRKYNKSVIIMEPVKGGSLVNLPDEAKNVFDSLGSKSYASYALRFAAGFKGVISVLSGMGTMEMVRDNMNHLGEFTPLSSDELDAINKVVDILHSGNTVPCTDCKYCTERCPQNIPIPEIFACLNAKRTFNNWGSSYYYDTTTKGKGKACDCIECGLCEESCPQHLKIRELLKESSEHFDKK